jgi:hypothetical protein
MAARLTDEQRKQKERKQKIVLAVGVGLLGILLVVQLPKLMGRSTAEAAPEAPAEAAGTEAAEAAGTAPALSNAGMSAESRPGAPLTSGIRFRVGDGQLASLGRLPVKDPFLQQVNETGPGPGKSEVSEEQEAAGGAPRGAADAQEEPSEPPGPALRQEPSGEAPAEAPAPPAEPAAPEEPGPADEPAPGQEPAPAPAGDGDAPSGEEPAGDAPPPAPGYATVSINGQVLGVELKQTFPEQEPLFVLVSLAAKEARLAVAGGSFSDGRPAVTLIMGRPLTLVNEATGERYVLELLHTGTEPETTASFEPAGEPAPEEPAAAADEG